MNKLFMHKIKRVALCTAVLSLSLAPLAQAESDMVAAEGQTYVKQRLSSKPLPFGVKLSLSQSYKKPGMASLNFRASNVESSCASIDDYDVELKDNLGMLEIEFSGWAIQTYKMLDDKGNDVCGRHSYAEYRLPLDLKAMVEGGVKQVRIWNRTMSDAFDLREENGVYKLIPRSKQTYFKVDNAENELVYEPMPAGAFRVFPDYAPYNEDLMLRKLRALVRESGYEIHDYKVRHDERQRPYYVVLDNSEMKVSDRLKDEPYFTFQSIDIDEDGRVVPLRVNIGRL
ncbi:MAG: hypothetical protein CL561_06930 [Alphaproteobacteria bacterium]|nr:hypothetical protein [Alphaproteobacteria bacterium]